MFGFFVGAVSLFGLVRVLKHGHHGHFGHHGHHGGGPDSARRRRWMMRWLFQYLDTTPGQEKVFEAAAEDLEGRARQMREEFEQLRRDTSKAMRGEAFDAAAVRESFARQRAHLDTLEEAMVGHLGKAHEALDPDQRSRLAELIEEGPRRAMHGRWGHGMRRCGGRGYGHHHDHHGHGHHPYQAI